MPKRSRRNDGDCNPVLELDQRTAALNGVVAVHNNDKKPVRAYIALPLSNVRGEYGTQTLPTLAVIMMVTLIAPAKAAPMLTGGMVFDASGAFVWSTNSFGYYLFMAEGTTGGPMINDADGHISYTLTPGVHTFYLFGD